MSAKETFSGRRPRPLDEETIDAVRRRIGIRVRYSPRSHNEVSSTDSFRHFALAYGDDNPLYTDPAYAAASPWGASIAPPLYVFSTGLTRPVEWTEAERQEMAGGDPLGGIGQYMCGERWVFPRPVRAGDALWREQALHAAELRASSFGGGTGALVSHRVTWDDGAGTPYAHRFLDFWHADRERSRAAATNQALERPHYTDEDLQRLDECYEAEQRRGGAPRTIADVQVGEELGPIAKGPLSITEMVAWHIGVGWGMYGGGASRVAYENRKRIPKFYLKNELGFFDAAQRAHWDDEWAQRMGHLAAYDYGVMRTNWMVHLVTNWMGDGAWLWKVSASARKFNYIGDSHLVSGMVREVDRAAGAVTIDTWGVNQRGQTTCDGRIVVLLPADAGAIPTIPEYDSADEPEATAP